MVQCKGYCRISLHLTPIDSLQAEPASRSPARNERRLRRHHPHRFFIPHNPSFFCKYVPLFQHCVFRSFVGINIDFQDFDDFLLKISRNFCGVLVVCGIAPHDLTFVLHFIRNLRDIEEKKVFFISEAWNRVSCRVLLAGPEGRASRVRRALAQRVVEAAGAEPRSPSSLLKRVGVRWVRRSTVGWGTVPANC